MNLHKVVVIAFAAFLITITFIIVTFSNQSIFRSQKTKPSPLSLLSTKDYAIAVEKPGCNSLNCIVSAKDNISPDLNGEVIVVFSKSDKIEPSSNYDVFVCTPNCADGITIEGWDRKNCTSTEDALITIDLEKGICS